MEYVTAFTEYLFSILDSLGVWAYWIILLIACADSIIVIGTFTAGAAFLFLAGVLVSYGIYDLGDMTLFAAVGAILGGLVSYYLGAAGTGFLTQKAQKTEKNLGRATRLVESYGGVGLLLGRFLGPASSVITFVAGLSGMSLRTFLVWNILSGLVWATVFVFLGNFFGTSVSWFGDIPLR